MGAAGDSQGVPKARRRGKARATLDEALTQAYQGVTKARRWRASPWNCRRWGDGQRAERVLLDALERIEGVDFGFGGTADILDAAIKMNRLDLVERIYDQSDPGRRLLLCIVASTYAAYGP